MKDSARETLNYVQWLGSNLHNMKGDTNTVLEHIEVIGKKAEIALKEDPE